MAGKRLQLLKELVSPLTRVAILYNPEDRNKEWEYKQSLEAADKLKLVLRAYEARSSIEIDEAFTRMVDDHTQALVIFADILMLAHQKTLETGNLDDPHRIREWRRPYQVGTRFTPEQTGSQPNGRQPLFGGVGTEEA
jgi:hypothetical protein